MTKITGLIVAFLLAGVMYCGETLAESIVREYSIEKQYLNFPVEMKQDRQRVAFVSNEDTLTSSVIRIAERQA